MMYPFMQLNDKTEIVHSEMRYDDSGNEYVKVLIEKPIYGGFKSAECCLPKYQWSKIEGFTEEEIQELEKFLESVAHLIMRFAREGGLDNAANF